MHVTIMSIEINDQLHGKKRDLTGVVAAQSLLSYKQSRRIYAY